MDNKTIIWHSDSGNDNILKFYYKERTITISLIKSKETLPHENNVVRVRTSGSSYEYYYQEFLDFFERLSALEFIEDYSINEERTASFQRKM